jgi:hypothetical protein
MVGSERNSDEEVQNCHKIFGNSGKLEALGTHAYSITLPPSAGSTTERPTLLQYMIQLGLTVHPPLLHLLSPDIILGILETHISERLLYSGA